MDWRNRLYALLTCTNIRGLQNTNGSGKASSNPRRASSTTTACLNDCTAYSAPPQTSAHNSSRKFRIL